MHERSAWRRKELSLSLSSHAELLEIIESVMGEDAVVSLDVGQIESVIEIRGKLESLTVRPELRKAFLWIDTHSILLFFEDHFESARTWSADDGGYWGIIIHHGGYRISIGGPDQ